MIHQFIKKSILFDTSQLKKLIFLWIIAFIELITSSIISNNHMLTAIVAAGISSVSAYGLYSGIKGYNKTTKQKKELGDNIVEFKDLIIEGSGTKKLTTSVVETNSGLLEVFKIKEQSEISYVRSHDSNFFFINPNVSIKKHIFSQLIEPKLGLEKYIPSLNDKSYLLDNVLTEKSEGTGNIIASDISAKYDFPNLLLSSSNKYLTIFYPLKNRTVYMYGFTNGFGDFISEYISTDKEQVIDQVFKSQSDNNFNKIFFSMCGFATAIGIVVVSKN
jgi:hypothetical protein